MVRLNHLFCVFKTKNTNYVYRINSHTCITVFFTLEKATINLLNYMELLTSQKREGEIPYPFQTNYRHLSKYGHEKSEAE